MLAWLAEGNLTTDGFANQAAKLVSSDLSLLPELIECLDASDDALRGHAADALKKVARSHPDEVVQHLPELIRCVRQDGVPMVHWHLAMTLGHLSIFPAHAPRILDALLFLLDQGTVMTKCWAIVSLCILARQYPEMVEQVSAAILPLNRSASAALRSKVGFALPLLANPNTPFPKGWVKSNQPKLG